MESRLIMRVIGNYKIGQDKGEECSKCHNAHFGTIIIKNSDSETWVCVECLLKENGEYRNIIKETGRVIERLDVPLGLKATLGSFKDTLTNEEIIENLKGFKNKVTLCRMGYDKDISPTICVFKCENCKDLRETYI